MLCFEALENTNHGHFDNVGGCALDGRINGVALGKAANGGVL